MTAAGHVNFDHRKIIDYAIERLRNKLEYTTAGFKLLPEQFTLSELQAVYEAILGKKLDKRNFRKKVLGFDLLLPLKETQLTCRHRPAQLFRFDTDKYAKLRKRGFNFEL